MSLAMFAASFDDNSNITLPNNLDSSENILNQKRHKRTQRKYPKIENFDTNKVNSVLEKIHNTTDDDNDDDDDKFTFNPPPKPESMSGLRTIPKQENKINEPFTIPLGKTIGRAPVPNYEGSDNLDLNDYSNYGDSKTVEEYYKSILPGYNQQKNVINKSHINRQHYPQPQNNLNEYPTQDILLKKLNYMISLLEEQQDEKTSNVTEEVILYSFLGIFIIFIADTFVRAGKYTR
jgi:hypothetical protein